MTLKKESVDTSTKFVTGNRWKIKKNLGAKLGEEQTIQTQGGKSQETGTTARNRN